MTETNYTGGEGAGSSWTDKVMSFKGQQEIPHDEGAGADDDEWVSVLFFEKQDVVMPVGDVKMRS